MPPKNRLSLEATKAYQTEQLRIRTERRQLQLRQEQCQLELKEVLNLLSLIWLFVIVLLYVRLYLGKGKISNTTPRPYRGYVRAPASLVLCRRQGQAFRNITLWYFRQGRVDSVYPTGTVFHPSDRRLLASFSLPLIFLWKACHCY